MEIAKYMNMTVFLFTLVIVACSSNRTSTVGEQPTNPVTNKEVAVAETQGAHVVSSITFDKGKTELNQKAKEEINTAIWKARQQGEVDDVIVTVWADEPYPGKSRKLPQRQVDLADERGEQIEDYLEKNLDISDVKVHNMGKKPNALAETFKTADAELKDQLQKYGVASNGSAQTKPSRVSTALIMVQVK